MTESELEAAVLQLPPNERARLAERLLASLESLAPDEQDEAWATVAVQRDRELDVSPEHGRDQGLVFADAKARVSG